MKIDGEWIANLGTSAFGFIGILYGGTYKRTIKPDSYPKKTDDNPNLTLSNILEFFAETSAYYDEYNLPVLAVTQ